MDEEEEMDETDEMDEEEEEMEEKELERRLFMCFIESCGFDVFRRKIMMRWNSRINLYFLEFHRPIPSDYLQYEHPHENIRISEYPNIRISEYPNI